MKVSDLSPEVIERIKSVHYDRILEKHEGPWKWSSMFQYGRPEFMLIQNRFVLLPIDREYHSNITVLRVVVSEDGKLLTVFLKDTTFSSGSEWEHFESGRITICEKMPSENFYVATLYHEMFHLDNAVFNQP